MLPSKRELSRLLGTLYDAASDPQLWTPFLENLSRTAGAQSALLLMHNAGQEIYTVARAWQVDPAATRVYESHFHKMDLWAHRGLRKPAGTVCSSEELATRGEIEATEHYNDFMTKFDIEYGMFGVVENSASRWASVSLFRSRSRCEFQLNDVETLEFLTPHVRRAFKLHFQLSEAKSRSTNLIEAVDAVPDGVVFLGHKGQIASMNCMASAILSRRDGLKATHDGLIRAEKTDESAALTRTIADAVSQSNGASLCSRLSLQVSRRSGPPLQVAISPLRERQSESNVAAVLIIADPSQRSRSTQTALFERFGLTPAECRIALMLTEGKSPRQISEAIGVTFNTVRSQIKSIFSKTGARRQGELIGLLLR
jgi:DNA-binding CsgD family transcriptional regulator